MAYTYKNSRGQTYYLHSRKSGRGGNGQIYFFAKEEKDDTMDKLPEGYEVKEIERTGLPVLKKKGKS